MGLFSGGIRKIEKSEGECNRLRSLTKDRGAKTKTQVHSHNWHSVPELSPHPYSKQEKIKALEPKVSQN
jgi:hypothetical protein